ncbi:hypothetical protein SRHO_G00104270 [Serrasalmus rhombeus]
MLGVREECGSPALQVGALIASVIFYKPSKAGKQKLRSGQQVHASALLQEPNRSCSHRVYICHKLLYRTSSIQVGALIVSVIFSKPSKGKKQELRSGQQVHASALLQEPLSSSNLHKRRRCHEGELKRRSRRRLRAATVLLEEPNRSCSNRV